MNKAKLIEALNMIIEALGEEETVSTPTVEPKKAPKAVATKKAPAKEEVKEEVTETVVEEEPATTEPEETEVSTDVDVETIKAMGYNELKKFAQSVGVKAVGTRDQILNKVLEAMDSAEEVVDEKEEPEVKENSKVIPISKGKKAGLKKKSEPEPEEEPEEEMDEVEKSVRAEAEDMDVTDIAELLQSVGVKASGKKDKLITLLVEAVKEGKLDFSDEEEDGSEEVEVTETAGEEEVEEVDFTEYHAEYDPSGLNDPKNMSKKRAKEVGNMIDREVSAIQSGETTDKDVRDFLMTLLTEDEVKEFGVETMDDNNLVFLYIELMKSMIDDDGEEHEPADPYSIGDENVCCGHVLEYDEESEQYICQSCGQNYEAE